MFREKVIESFIEDLIDHSLQLRIDELFLGLGRESEFWNLHRYDRTDTFEDIDGFEIGIFFLQEFLFSSVFIDRASECHLEANSMCSPISRRDIIRETDNLFGVIIFLVLESDLDIDMFDLFFDIEYFIRNSFRATIQVEYIGLDPSLEKESIV